MQQSLAGDQGCVDAFSRAVLLLPAKLLCALLNEASDELEMRDSVREKLGLFSSLSDVSVCP